MTTNSPYRVLARKYRPQKLSELVGQDVLVTTLAQAIDQDRLPHAFVLHGIRGVGKTTTARILAKALNCVGPDGQGLPTPDPCGVCASCCAIVEERHMDVVEMDAASRTGVDDIREVIEASRYKAVNGRFKIYIIDEVHMLSKSAFNALLKTLEEPPPHVKFIFATTELKKIPDTVLSRCMRFDLNRISPQILLDHFKMIANLEGVTIDDESLALIVRAADGSVRDGLSLLDQAIALASGPVTVEIVRNMLGLVERGQLFSLLNDVLNGEATQTLSQVRHLISCGGDPTVILEELLNLTYWVSTIKACPALKQDPTWPESDRQQGAQLADKLSLPALMQAWQVLSKGYEEVLRSPLPNQAMEMVLLRVCYLSPLPSAEDLLSLIHNKPIMSPTTALNLTTSPQLPKTFNDLVAMVAQAREGMIHAHLIHDVQLIEYMPGKLVLHLNDRVPKNFVAELGKVLQNITQTSWQILTETQKPAQPTLAEQKRAQQQSLTEESLNHPLVQKLVDAFPGSTIAVKP